jgi:acyl-CoA-dependent ceramide synthase
MAVWGYMRHYVNLKILYSILTEFQTVGPWELNWETQQYKCRLSQYITFSLMASLQAINLFWWFLICRIAYRFVVNDGLADERSEYEDSEGEEERRERKKKAAKNGTVNGAPKLLVNGEAMASSVGVEEGARERKKVSS